jgi:hypothetical protein
MKTCLVCNRKSPHLLVVENQRTGERIWLHRACVRALLDRLDRHRRRAVVAALLSQASK